MRTARASITDIEKRSCRRRPVRQNHYSVKRTSSKPTSSRAQTAYRGDVEAAIDAAQRLRAAGFAPTTIGIGGVHITLAPPRDSAGASGIAMSPPRSLAEEYGGPEMARLLENPQAELVDDEDQPAVKS